MANVETQTTNTAVVGVMDNKVSNIFFVAGGAGTTPKGTLLVGNGTDGEYTVGTGANATAVLQDDVVATVAGNIPAVAILQGEVDGTMLSISGGGTIDQAVKVQLQDYGILVRNVTQLGVL